MTKPQSSAQIRRLLQNIAIISAIFAVIVCVLIIVNYIQIKFADPLNTSILKTLVDRLHGNSGDEQLRQEIRELDLLARKAFFTSQWQVRMGGYLLFFSLLVVVICLKSIELLQKTLPAVPPDEKTAFWVTRKINRTWVAYTGISIVVISLLLVILTHQELGKTLDKALEAIPDSSGSAIESAKGRQPIISQSGLNGDTLKMDSAGKKQNPREIVENFPSWQEITGNFPSFRGAGGNGIAYQKNIPISWDGKSGKNIKWKSEIPLPGYNSPVIWKDKIFLSGASENKREVYCIDLNSGKILWRTAVVNIPGSPAQPPKVNRETGFSAPTVTTDGIRVYAIFANGDIISLDLEGKKVWDKNLGSPKNHYGHSSSLIIYQDKLIIQYDQSGNAFVLALSAKTGEEIWRTTREVRVSWASPVIVNTGKRMELILAADPYVASYSPETGKELWKLDCISGEVGPSVAYADGVVYSVNDYSKLAAVEIADPPKLLWEDNEYLSDIPSPLATGKYLFLVTSYGTVVCYDARNGTKYWVQEYENPIFASPILAEGKVYLLDKKGIMHIFKAYKNYTKINEPQLGEGSVCTPAFADGKIIIRGDKNLYCIGK